MTETAPNLKFVPRSGLDSITGVDAFMAGGYRNLVLKLFEINLRDLLSKDPVLAKEARDWFDPVAGRNAAITFEDCVFVMGWASVIERARALALSDPAKMLADFQFALQSIAREGVILAPRASAEVGDQSASKGVDVDTLGSIQRAMFGHA